MKTFIPSKIKLPVFLLLGLLAIGNIVGLGYILFAFVRDSTVLQPGNTILTLTETVSPTHSGINLPMTWTPGPTLTFTPYPTLWSSSTAIPSSTLVVLPASLQSATSTLINTPLSSSTITPNTHQKTLPPPTKTKVPTPTKTKMPTPTKTAKVKATCGISPSTIPGAQNTTITLYVNFYPPTAGLGFDVSFDHYWSGQKGCSGVDGDGDGYASCNGKSGMLPVGKTVTVTFNTSVGKCYATYTSQ